MCIGRVAYPSVVENIDNFSAQVLIALPKYSSNDWMTLHINCTCTLTNNMIQVIDNDKDFNDMKNNNNDLDNMIIERTNNGKGCAK